MMFLNNQITGGKTDANVPKDNWKMSSPHAYVSSARAASQGPQHVLPDCEWQHITFTMPHLL